MTANEWDPWPESSTRPLPQRTPAYTRARGAHTIVVHGHGHVADARKPSSQAALLALLSGGMGDGCVVCVVLHLVRDHASARPANIAGGLEDLPPAGGDLRSHPWSTCGHAGDSHDIMHLPVGGILALVRK